MEQIHPHPMETLLLHVAKKLRDQYSDFEQRDEFARLIADAESYATKSDAANERRKETEAAAAAETEPPVDS